MLDLGNFLDDEENKEKNVFLNKKIEVTDNHKIVYDLDDVSSCNQVWNENGKEFEIKNNEIYKIDRIEKVEKFKKVEKVKKIIQIEQFERIEKIEKIDKNDNVEKIDKIAKIEKIEKIEKGEKFDKIEKIEKIEKGEKFDKIDKIEKVEKFEKIEKLTSKPTKKQENQENSINQPDHSDDLCNRAKDEINLPSQKSEINTSNTKPKLVLSQNDWAQIFEDQSKQKQQDFPPIPNNFTIKLNL